MRGGTIAGLIRDSKAAEPERRRENFEETFGRNSLQRPDDRVQTTC